MHHSTSLNWVKPGVDEELDRLRHLLSDVAEAEGLAAEHAGYAQARQLLHRLRLTFELLQVYGAALLAEEMEGLAAGLEHDQVEQREDGLRLLMQGSLHLPHYLERVQRTGRDIPVLMTPLLNDIRALLGRQLLSATSFFSPDLEPPIPGLPPSLVETGAVRPEAVKLYARKLRLYYQRALVDWYRGRSESAALKTIVAVLAHLERLAGGGALWWVASAVAAALREGSLAPSVSVKLLMGQVDREIRHLVVEGADALARPAPTELLKNLLFYVGQARSRQPRVAAVRRHYRLDELLPGAHDDEALLGPGLEVLGSVSDALLENLAQVKDVLDIYVRQEEPAADRLEPALGLLERIADTLALLGLGAARNTVRRQAETLQSAVDGHAPPDDAVLFQVAESLLEVDDALSSLTSEGFTQAVDADEEPAATLAGGSHQDRQLFETACAEVRTELAGIREEVTAHLSSPGDTGPLGRVDDGFRRVAGALAILGLDAGDRAAGALRRYVRERMAGLAPALPEEEELRAFADGVVGVDYYLEALGERRSDADEILGRVERVMPRLRLGPELEESEQDLEEVQLAPPAPEDETADPEAAAPLEEGEYREEDTEEITLNALPEAGEESLPGALIHSLQRARDRMDRLDGETRAPAAGDPGGGTGTGTERPPGDGAPEAAPDEHGEPASAQDPPPAPAGAPAESDPEIVAIFLEEAGEVLQEIRDNLQRWRAQPDDPDALGALRRGFHTLKGSGRLVGAEVVGELAWSLEQLLNRLLDGTLAFAPAQAELVDEAAAALPALVEDFQAGRAPRSDAAGLMERAAALTRGGPPPPGGDGSGPGGAGGESGAPGGGRPPGGPAGGDDAGAASRAAPGPGDGHGSAEPPADAAADAFPHSPLQDPAVLELFRGEAQSALRQLEGYAGTLSAVGGPVPADLCRLCHSLRGSTRLVGLEGLAGLFATLETALEAARGRSARPSPVQWAVLGRAAQALARDIASLGQPEGAATPEDLVALREEAANLAAAEPSSPPGEPGPEAPRPPDDDLLGELREVFSEEADELLRAVDPLMQRWQGDEDAGDILPELQRHLHTLKGGARMAEVTAMGDLAHALESLLRRLGAGETATTPEVRGLAREATDRLAEMLEALRDGAEPAPTPGLTARLESDAGTAPGAQPAPVPSAVPSPLPVAPQGGETAAPEVAPEAGARAPEGAPATDGEPARPGAEAAAKVSVRAGLLDTLVDRAGEISIARTRVEEQVGSVRYSLDEMERTVHRLRDQIRGLEMETEARIASGQRTASDPRSPGFDPLELDRFTRMQELSRGVLESVTDLDSIRVQLNELTRDSESILLEQARLSSELQKNLMTTRLVPLARYVPRLGRVVRQTAAALGKPAELVVTGQDQEVDHAILERLVAPLEHILRNAVDHGLETRDERSRAGKPPTGQLALACYRDGAEVVLEVRDDGRGFDLAAIRRQAESRGLIAPGVAVADDELVQFVFEQSFSTATQVTQISGRGVGMDVVNVAIDQLGGTLQLDTRSGVGTTLRMRLPTTLSLSHALLVQAGEEVLAVPLANVEGVVRMTREQAETLLASDEPAFEHMGQRYRLVHLGGLLGVPGDRALPGHPRLPVVLGRSGDRRVAFLVDGVSGRQEIVIKPVGAQVATVRWINGATILGDGRVVLVVDLPGLIRLSAVSATVQGEAIAPARRSPVVMVVDDSITVRRVTERFLARHGMEVVLAKDGVEALSLLRERSADLMLLDVEMPRMDGFELATTVRNDTRLRALPIIMITSRTGEKHSSRAEAIGVDRYLGKPYHEEELLQSIRSLLGGAGG